MGEGQTTQWAKDKGQKHKQPMVGENRQWHGRSTYVRGMLEWSDDKNTKNNNTDKKWKQNNRVLRQHKFETEVDPIIPEMQFYSINSNGLVCLVLFLFEGNRLTFILETYLHSFETSTFGINQSLFVINIYFRNDNWYLTKANQRQW